MKIIFAFLLFTLGASAAQATEQFNLRAAFGVESCEHSPQGVSGCAKHSFRPEPVQVMLSKCSNSSGAVYCSGEWSGIAQADGIDFVFKIDIEHAAGIDEGDHYNVTISVNVKDHPEGGGSYSFTLQSNQLKDTISAPTKSVIVKHADGSWTEYSPVLGVLPAN